MLRYTHKNRCSVVCFVVSVCGRRCRCRARSLPCGFETENKNVENRAYCPACHRHNHQQRLSYKVLYDLSSSDP